MDPLGFIWFHLYTVRVTDLYGSIRPSPENIILPKQAKIDFHLPQQPVTKRQLDKMIARYVVEEMLPLSTVESVPFRALVSKIPVNSFFKCVFYIIIFQSNVK